MNNKQRKRQRKQLEREAMIAAFRMLDNEEMAFYEREMLYGSCSPIEARQRDLAIDAR